MKESSPYDTGNNKWIGRIISKANTKPFYQVRFTKIIPGKFSASGFARQKTLFSKIFFFHNYDSELSCLEAARTVRDHEALARGLNLKQRKPNKKRDDSALNPPRPRRIFGFHAASHVTVNEPNVCALPRLDGHGDVIRSKNLYSAA